MSMTLACFALTIGLASLILGTALQKRMRRIENKLHNLAAISEYFPEFISKGETIARSLTEELALRQQALKKLVGEAEKNLEKLQHFEEKVRERKLDKERINQVLILFNQGFGMPEIASRLNIPLGEIELIINLRKYLQTGAEKL